MITTISTAFWGDGSGGDGGGFPLSPSKKQQQPKNPINLKPFSIFQLLNNAKNWFNCVWAFIHLCDCFESSTSMCDSMKLSGDFPMLQNNNNKKLLAKKSLLETPFWFSKFMADWIDHNRYITGLSFLHSPNEMCSNWFLILLTENGMPRFNAE